MNHSRTHNCCPHNREFEYESSNSSSCYPRDIFPGVWWWWKQCMYVCKRKTAARVENNRERDIIEIKCMSCSSWWLSLFPATCGDPWWFAISRELWKLAKPSCYFVLSFARSSGASLSEFCAKLIILFAYIFIETTHRRINRALRIHGIHMWFACAVRHRLHDHDQSLSADCHIWMQCNDDDRNNDDHGIRNVWLQFTIYTSFSGDNFKWNVSTLAECCARFPVSVGYSASRFSCVKQ